jgi:NADH:ubiquinone oxidoreductase subunit E
MKDKKVDTHIEIQVCHGDRCQKNLSKYIFERAEHTLGIKQDETTDDGVHLEKMNCQGRCRTGPNVKIVDHRTGKIYIMNQMDPLKMAEAIGQIRTGNIPPHAVLVNANHREDF